MQRSPRHKKAYKHFDNGQLERKIRQLKHKNQVFQQALKPQTGDFQSFSAMQNSRGKETHVVFYAFDLLNLAGLDVTSKPLAERANYSTASTRFLT